MEKAKFICKYRNRRYNEDITELEYEYRGHRYIIYVNNNKSNEPLVWQHKNAQGRIDTLIELEDKKEGESKISVDEIIEKFLNYCDN